ncbi:MAG: SpaA isopeptide-forming pilin-related protein, partial [Oscillospiraceae bacterium]
MRIKGLLKKALAAVTSAAMALSFVTAESVSADTGYIYQKTVSIEQILADFQYFVQEDADVTMHQVGTLYVGGTAQIGSFGDGAMVNSYVKDLECIVSTNFGAYLPEALKKYKSETLYVGNTLDELISNYNVPGWMYLYNPKYITPTSDEYVAADTFDNLIAASQGYAAAAQTSNVTMADNVITIDVTSEKKATIPASMLGSDTKILFKGITSAADFGNEAIIVSFIGINGNTFDLNSSNIFFDVIDNSHNLREEVRALGVSKGDVQILKEGAYKLIWNFPDASGKITCGAFSGHIVAPQAFVTADEGGAFVGAHEGGIIAKSVSAHNSEGHFYPFYPLEENPPTPTDEKTKNIVFRKAYEINGAETVDISAEILENTVFTLQDTDTSYPEILEACPAKVTEKDADGNVIDTYFTVTFLSKGGKILGGHKYIIKETASAGGFEASTDVWYALVPAIGSSDPVKFSRQIDGVYTADVPVFTNTKTTYNFSFTKTDGTDPLAGAVFTLYKGGNVIAAKTSAADGKVSFENIEAGTYTMSETTVPEGYEDNETIYTVTVSAGGTAISAPAGDSTLSGTTGAYTIKNTRIPLIFDIDPIEVIKTYQDADFTAMSDSEITALLNGTEFTIYDGTTAVDTQKPVKDGNSGKVTFSTGIECGKLYKIAETASPDGYELSTAVWYAKVAADGTVTYST